MFVKLGAGEEEGGSVDMADYYLRVLLPHLRNHTDQLRQTGLQHDNLLSLLNLTQEDLQLVFNTTMMPVTRPPCYCGGTLREVAASYQLVHGYFSLVVCVFGSIANLLNIVVLTRKELVGAPINRILTGIAVADLLVMLEYIPFAVYMYVLSQPGGDKQFSHAEAVYILVHMHFSQLMHTVSICLTLTLALWRYLAIQFPHKSHTLCSEKRCKMALVIAVLLPVVICIPSYFVFSVRATRVVENRRPVILYHLDLSVKTRKQRLRCDLFPSSENQRTYKPEKRVDRTTKMLVAVLLLFLITEIPQGVLGLLSGILGRCFFKNCYHKLGELMDILALINGAINFILYCSMSRQFRQTFSKMFKPKLLSKCGPPQTDVQSTYV